MRDIPQGICDICERRLETRQMFSSTVCWPCHIRRRKPPEPAVWPLPPKTAGASDE